MGNQSKRTARPAAPAPAPQEPSPHINPERLINRLRVQVSTSSFEAANYAALADELADQVAAKDKALTELEAALEELKGTGGGGEEPSETPDLKAVT